MNQARRSLRKRYASQDSWGLAYLLFASAGMASACIGVIFMMVRI